MTALILRIITLTFLMLIPINFIGMCECKNWQKDEKYWLFALVMSALGFFFVAFIVLNNYDAFQWR